MAAEETAGPAAGYDIGPQARCGDARLHLNEFRGEHHPGVLVAMGQWFRSHVPASRTNVEEALLSHYPTGPDPLFVEAIARSLGENMPLACVHPTPGSDELLRAVLDACPFADLVVGVPTYTHFLRYARLKQMAVHAFGLLDKNSFELGATDLPTASLECYSELMDQGCLVYLGNPNNPVGGVWPLDQLERLISAHPRSWFLLDEAYIEFPASVGSLPGGTPPPAATDAPPKRADRVRAMSAASLVPTSTNLIVARTFSKCYGLAQQRVGYGVCSPPLAPTIAAHISPKALGVLPTTAAMAVLAHQEYYLAQAAETVGRKEKYQQILGKMGHPVIPGGGNFLLVYFGPGLPQVLKKLRAGRMHVRDRSTLPGLDGFLRVSIGTEFELAAFCSAVAAIPTLARPSSPGPIQKYYTPKSTIARLRRLLARLWPVLESAKIRSWIDGGTLLGYWRHGGIIPFDDDLDLGYLVEAGQPDPVPPLGAALEASGLVLQRNRTGAYWQIADRGEYAEACAPQAPGTPGAPHINTITHLDLTGFSAEEGHYVCQDPRFAREDPESPLADCNLRYSIKNNELLPLQDALLYNHAVKVPNKIEPVLTRALGANHMAVARLRPNGRKSAAAISFPLEDLSPA